MASKFIKFKVGSIGEGVKTNSQIGRSISKWVRRFFGKMSKEFTLTLDNGTMTNQTNDKNFHILDNDGNTKDEYKEKLLNKLVFHLRAYDFIAKDDSTVVALYEKEDKKGISSLLTNQKLIEKIDGIEDKDTINLIINIHSSLAAVKAKIYFRLENTTKSDTETEKATNEPFDHELFNIIIKKDMRDRVLADKMSIKLNSKLKEMDREDLLSKDFHIFTSFDKENVEWNRLYLDSKVSKPATLKNIKRSSFSKIISSTIFTALNSSNASNKKVGRILLLQSDNLNPITKDLSKINEKTIKKNE